MASDSTNFNLDTTIFSENDNIKKQNVQGQKPFKYYIQDFSKPQLQGLPEIGYHKFNGNTKNIDHRPQPTRLNEISDPLKTTVNAAFLGSDNVSQKNIDIHSDLRWGGRIRCKKGQQLLSEIPQHRHDFIQPSVNQQVENKYSSDHVIPLDADFVRGGALSIPNYKALGNNMVPNERFGLGTRNNRQILHENS